MNVAGLQLAVLTRGNLKGHTLAFVEGLITVHLDLGEVNEKIFAIGLGDKSVALLGVEPFDSSFSHFRPLSLPELPGMQSAQIALGPPKPAPPFTMEQNASIVHDGTGAIRSYFGDCYHFSEIARHFFMNFENLQFADELLTCG